MLRLGEYQTLVVEKIEKHGVYLKETDTDSKEHVLLPGIDLLGNERIGDEIDVFLYLDSEDRLIATRKSPKLSLGEIAPLEVKEVTKIGAFLDMGLPRDVLLPYREMIGRPKEGQRLLVRLYIDKTGRLCVSMKKLYSLLRTDHPYVIGEEVEGRIYEFGHDFGTFVAVSDIYSGMIPRHEDVSRYRIGDVVKMRITGIKPDGKIDLSLRNPAHRQIEEDADVVMECIHSYAGVLPFSEKADPAVISRETGLSKAAFKRAVGHLYKKKLISISDEGKIRAK